jgi:HD-like signal output (HDOD) protein
MTISGEKIQTNKDIPDKILQQISAFPSMPKAALKLRALISKKDVSIAEIERILRHDPGLAANVLRLANSAFFGLASKVNNLKHAVMLL